MQNYLGELTLCLTSSLSQWPIFKGNLWKLKKLGTLAGTFGFGTFLDLVHCVCPILSKVAWNSSSMATFWRQKSKFDVKQFSGNVAEAQIRAGSGLLIFFRLLHYLPVLLAFTGKYLNLRWVSITQKVDIIAVINHL